MQKGQPIRTFKLYGKIIRLQIHHNTSMKCACVWGVKWGERVGGRKWAWKELCPYLLQRAALSLSSSFSSCSSWAVIPRLNALASVTVQPPVVSSAASWRSQPVIFDTVSGKVSFFTVQVENFQTKSITGKLTPWHGTIKYKQYNTPEHVSGQKSTWAEEILKHKNNVTVRAQYLFFLLLHITLTA